MLKAEPGIWRTARERVMDALCAIERCYATRESGSDRNIGWADLYTLDALTGGIRPGRFYLLGAAPGDGKTAFLTGLALAAARTKRRVGIISLRDSGENMSLRLLGGESRIDPVAVRKAKLHDKDFENIAQSASKLAGYFPANAALRNANVEETCEFIHQISAVKRLELILVDDIDACHALPDESTNPLLEKINRLGSLARELNLPLVGTASLDTAGILPPNERCGHSISNILPFANADLIALIRKKTGGEFSLHELQLARNALGPTATLPLFFNQLTQRFFEIAE